jgi:hypothetical protein
MAILPLSNMAALSVDKATAGAQMTEQFAGLAHPTNSQVRREFVLKSRTRNVAGAQELFIDGALNYRLKGISDSTIALRGQVCYNSNVTADCAVFDVTIAARVLNGVLSFIGAPTITKIGASAATLTAVANTPAGCITFNAVGVGGNTVAMWIGAMLLTESTDFPV